MEVAIVGAGIVGLAHAWAAAERGHRVTVLERSPRASGASVRNFGQIWPVGQTAGRNYSLALASRERWLTLGREAGVWLRPCGSIHLAHREDEWAVISEFAEAAPSLGVACSLLTPRQVQEHTPGANTRGLLGALWSPTEASVNPRAAVVAFSAWLQARHSVRVVYSTTVTSIEPGTARSADGRSWPFDAAVVCGGADIDTLFPGVIAEMGLNLCKLQMFKTRPQPSGWSLGPHLAGGLTLRHYRNFEVCPSLSQLRRRIAEQTPELDRFGIHVMASQNDAGEVVLGDSHEYGPDIEPFDKQEIDDLILRELRKILSLPDWTITQHWHGIYAKHPTEIFTHARPMPGVHVFTGVGGTGMTMSLGVAEEAWKNWSAEI